MNWVLITGAYPPDKGGVADYTAVLAKELIRSGDAVTVVTGPRITGPGVTVPGDGVPLLTLPDHFGRRGLVELEAFLATVPGPRRLLVQYVPQAFGPRRSSRFKGLPLTFTRWMRRQNSAEIWTMLHEAQVTAPAGSALPRRVLSLITERMLAWTVQSSSRVFVAMQGWQPYVQRHLARGQAVEYLPIPSNVSTMIGEPVRAEMRAQLLGTGRTMVGHFGTYSTDVANLLEPMVRLSLQQHPERRILLVGDGSREFSARFPGAAVTATGRLEAEGVARHLAACDLMIQPFPDGASTRRGSIMAGLALGVPVASNWGSASEAIWREQGALALAANPESLPGMVDDLLAHPEECRALGERGRRLYEDQFSLAHTARVLRG